MERGKNMNKIISALLVVAMIAGVAWSVAFGVPMYMVWQQQKAGEAELARAEQNRQVAVLEAKAKLDSAESLAQAEVKRAEGTAKANQIIGQSLKGNEAYIHWLWVDTLKDSKDQIIYIPTEAGVPITESFRLKESK